MLLTLTAGCLRSFLSKVKPGKAKLDLFDLPQFTREEQKDVLQWGSVPYDPDVKGFGFKAGWRAASRLREKLREGDVRVRVEIQSEFHPGPNRSLVAEIPGRSLPDERIVMIAHVQEPGANDDASGCATLYGLARALAGSARILPGLPRSYREHNGAANG